MFRKEKVQGGTEPAGVAAVGNALEANGGKTSTAQRAYYASAVEVEKEYVMVPRYEISASAGGGAAVYSEQIVDYLAFKTDWVRDHLRLPPEAIALINVTGDSMEPALSDGDLVMIDLRHYRISSDAIYVLSFNGDLLVKRTQKNFDGSVEIVSDNPRYKTILLTSESADQVAVVGKVVWYGRRG